MTDLSQLSDEEVSRKILKACEQFGFQFQRVYLVELRQVVTRRRQNCNEQQAQFWMCNATAQQKDGALTGALEFIELTSSATLQP